MMIGLDELITWMFWGGGMNMGCMEGIRKVGGGQGVGFFISSD